MENLFEKCTQKLLTLKKEIDEILEDTARLYFYDDDQAILHLQDLAQTHNINVKYLLYHYFND